VKVLLLSLCYFMKHFYQFHNHFTSIISSRMCSWKKYQLSNYSSNIYLHLRVQFFYFIVSWSSQMQFCVIYPETWPSIQPHIASWTHWFLLFFLVFSLGNTHRLVVVEFYVKSFYMWLVDGAFLPGLVVWFWSTVLALYIRSFTNANLNFDVRHSCCYQYMYVKLWSYIVIHNSQFIRSLCCISNYMFWLVYRAIFRLVFRVVCMYNCWSFKSYEIVYYK
jgi:hypothetical protein